MKSLILTKRLVFPWLYRNFLLFGRKSYLKNKSNHTVVQEDLFMAKNYRNCDHEASCNEDYLINKLTNNKNFKFLIDWAGEKYTNYVIGKRLIFEAKKIFKSFRYAEIISEKYSLKNNVYLYPDNFDISIYNVLKQKLTKKIKLPYLSLIYITLRSAFKSVYFNFKTLLYPEFLLLKSRKRSALEINKYKFCIHIDDGLKGLAMHPHDLFVINKNITKKDILFVSLSKIKQKWIPHYLKKNYNVLDINKINNYISKSIYFSNIYCKSFKFRFKLFWLGMKYPWLSSSIFNILKQKILWDIFHELIKTKCIIRIMTAEDITASVIHKYNNVDTLFLYLSTTEKIIQSDIKKGKSNDHDYTHMISKYSISNVVSNNWLKELENSIDNYIDIGPLFSDLINEAQDNKQKILNTININNNNPIISFLDHTAGHQGVMSVEAYKNFLQSIIELSNKNQDINYIYKSKKSISFMKTYFDNPTDSQIIELIEQIRSSNNCWYANDYKLNSYQVCGIADLVISAPMSSVIFESLCGNKKTISYDTTSEYKNFNSILKKVPYLHAYSHVELEKLIRHWVLETDKKYFNNYLDIYIKPLIGLNCNNHGKIKQFNEFLESIN
ncbi:MAG: hypothetical protein CMD65_03660 [Gammaproteobacteria bacterium]|nr:hypothetical protein [Gammaproteobacteria bacterium]